ncbi:gliding motility protein GldB-related protein [Dinghuibacter silviterrae]|uniref:Putative Zn-dependent protease DUF2268 n=1 Tax=Dinghuibacter silviterrae TaxID=1539049 RepID=A0A4R8DIQ6_9BACT|nr:hypothetical protein [Dinghuibacter silviterrae]TDW97447.1 putative Zn-dependent protease DUF2268 [Dinghuibacter silviterrae]
MKLDSSYIGRHVLSILAFSLYFFIHPAPVHGQAVFISDVDHFWGAFDSIQTTHDKDRQIQIMQSLYIDKGTYGLKKFMTLRKFDAARLVECINKYPGFWKSIRPNTLTIWQNEPLIESYLRKFKILYPDMRTANIYFTIGAIRAAGTTQDSLVLIGSEIAMGDKNTDVSEFPDKRLANFFNSKNSGNIIPVVIHECVHTQQRPEGKTLLAESIYEGACEFITELILAKPLENSYLVYGRTHEKELKQQFKKDMFSEDLSHWLYNGATSKTMGDLGYFMGYSICKSFYSHAKNKNTAIKAIINLNYPDSVAVKEFLKESRYY